MYIGFDIRGCGLGNNGGSRTIIKSQRVLEELGHRSDIIGSVDKFNWFKHKRPIKKLPEDVDALIATSCVTVRNTAASTQIPKRFWWVRAHEAWRISEGNLWGLYKIPELHLLVNSECLVEFLAAREIKSTLLYQGIDLDLWKDLGTRKPGKLRVGCLYSGKARKRWGDFRRLSGVLGREKFEYVAMGDSKCKESFLSRFIANPSQEDLRDLYSSCHIWFAPTDSEGLHNVPMEAALCGCLLVCNSAKLSGMKDYAIPGETAMVYPINNVGEASEMIKDPDFSLISRCGELIRDKIGSREKNMKHLLQIIGGQG